MWKLATKLLLLFLVFSLVTSAPLLGGKRFWPFSKTVKGSGDLVSETRDLDRFEGIKLLGSFDIDIVIGDEQKVRLTFDDNLLELIETRVEDDILILAGTESFSSRHNCEIEIVVENLEELAISGSGDITVSDLDEKYFRCRISGSGDIRLEGNVRDLELSISGSGDIDARELTADEAVVRISGSGDVRVRAIEVFDGKVSGSGDITYYGDPKHAYKKVSGSGRIRKR